MLNKNKTIYNILKYCLLFMILILSLSFINAQKRKIKLTEEKNYLFEQKNLKRNLQSEENNETDTNEICKRGFPDLIEYYQTGNSEKLKLEEKITCKDKDKYYMKALINIVEFVLNGNSTEEDEGLNLSENKDGTSTKEKNKRTLSKNTFYIKPIRKDIINYTKHLIPILIFILVAILCIPGWIVCCFCSCFDCCCCFCFKKSSFKIPCFIFALVLFTIIIIFCILGLIKSNSIFVGISSVECSFFQLLDQFLYGETKNKSPRWVGITGMYNILNNLINISYTNRGIKTNMDNKKSNINITKNSFITYMQGRGDIFFNGDNYKDEYSQDYTGMKIGGEILNGRYVLDIVKMFGKFESTSKKYLPENSTLNLWEKEYLYLSKNADKYIDKAYNSLSGVLNDNPDNTNLKSTTKEIMDFLRPEFDNIKIVFNEYLRLVDKKGKLGFILLFSVLGIINIIIAAFILLLLLYGKYLKKSNRFRCVYKLIIHFLWNILALLMIITFLAGSIIALGGRVGNDAVSLISYIISIDNTKFDLLDGLLRYTFNICINGDGHIIEVIFTPSKEYNKIKDVEQKIEEIKIEFNKKKQFITYNLYKDKLLKRANLNERQLCLIPQDANIDPQHLENFSQALNLDATLEKMNKLIQSDTKAYSYHEIWKKNSNEKDKICKEGNPGDFSHTSKLILNPKYCLPFYRNWINSLEDNNEIRNTAKIISDTILFIDNANKNADPYNDYFKILNDLKEQYENYLQTYIDALDFFNSTIKQIVGILNEYSVDENFTFINCKPTGTNVKIILKYSGIVFKNYVYNVGIYILIIGCSMTLSICSTIFLIALFNSTNMIERVRIQNGRKRNEEISGCIEKTEERPIKGNL